MPGPATLSPPLQRELSMYSVAARAAGVGVLSLAPLAAAQIVYTPAHETLVSGGKISIDFNHDGVTDVTLHEFPCSAGTGFAANSLQAFAKGPPSGIRMSPSVIGYAAALSAGGKIGESNLWDGKPVIMANWTNYGLYYYGSWVRARNTYLGVRFLIGGEAHYGWARLNVSYSGPGRDIVALLTGYAYQTHANTPILAGDRGEGSAGSKATGDVVEPTLPEKRLATLGALALGAWAISQARTLEERCPF